MIERELYRKMPGTSLRTRRMIEVDAPDVSTNRRARRASQTASNLLRKKSSVPVQNTRTSGDVLHTFQQ